ncbi:hypothetical protein IFM89_019976 [Coptis chinensis]|uniref:Uncharacterized protein n=1 Tax=Coptis chinensis TaxID=261450 RepID=A0A835I2H9_9MAGN|nr:hypothetical protein IFM89_019976 [Coptis chinensis]
MRQSVKESQLIGNVSSSLEVSRENLPTSVRIISPKEDDSDLLGVHAEPVDGLNEIFSYDSCEELLEHLDEQLDKIEVELITFLKYSALVLESVEKPKINIKRRIHLRLSLDGGYHVLDESMRYSNDGRPTAKQLWKPHVGVLEMGVLGATGLMPMKIKE